MGSPRCGVSMRPWPAEPSVSTCGTEGRIERTPMSWFTDSVLEYSLGATAPFVALPRAGAANWLGYMVWCVGGPEAPVDHAGTALCAEDDAFGLNAHHGRSSTSVT